LDKATGDKKLNIERGCRGKHKVTIILIKTAACLS